MADRQYIAPGTSINGFVYLGEAPDIGKERAVFARCACGNEKIFRLTYLRNGHTRSCGCARADANRKRATHGHTPRIGRNTTYAVYRDMLTRCTNPNYREFHLYGGRGITVCERWRESYENFLSDMGDRPEGMTLERDRVDDGYGPNNCRWATILEQANNKRNSAVIEHNGRSMTVAQWARELGVNPFSLYYRRSKGWSAERILAP